MKRRLQMLSDSIRAFPADAGDFGFRVALYKLRFSGREDKSAGYVKAVSSYTAKALRPLLDRYAEPGYQSILFEKKQIVKTPVWFCWLSASDSMPDAVDLCYHRMQRMIPDSAELHFLTLKNVFDYIDLPPVIEERYRSRKLNFRGLRDYVRAAVLGAYGGVWIDSEVYVLHKLPAYVINADFYSIKTEKKDPGAASSGNWNASVLAVKKNNPALCFLRDAQLFWWGSHDRQIDEAQFDYFLSAAFHTLPAVRAEINMVKANNPDFLAFRSLLNLPFDASVFRGITENNVFLCLSSDAVLLKETTAHEHTYFGTLYLKEIYGL